MKATAEKSSSTAPKHIQNERQPFFSKESRDPFFSDSFQSSYSFLTPHTIQSKLTIGRPGDKYEVEADAMADRVVQRLQQPGDYSQFKGGNGSVVQAECAECEGSENLQKKELLVDRISHIQRKPIFESDTEETHADVQTFSFENSHTQSLQAKCTECKQEEKLQKKEEDISEIDEGMETVSMSQDIPEKPDDEDVQLRQGDHSDRPPINLENQLKSGKGNGHSLPDDLQSSMGSVFGVDFSKVRVHTNSQAVQMNRQLGAQAFTHGSHIYFNEGKYNPDTDSGKHLLAHELTHTVQQGGAGKSGSTHTSIQRWPNWVSNAAGWVSDTASDVAGGVVEGAQWVGGKVKDSAQWVGGKVVSGAQWVGGQVSVAVQWIIDRIRSVIDSGKNYLNEKWDSIKEFGRTCFEDIKKGFGGLIHFVTSPLSSFMTVLSVMNADLLQSVWNSVKSGSNALWNGINTVINGVLQTGKGIWNTLARYMNSVFDTVTGLFNNVAFRLLPNWVQEEARSLYNGLRSLWDRVSSFWTNLWQRLTATIQEILIAVQSFVEKIINYGIHAVLTMVRDLKEVYDYISNIFADPQAFIEPILDQIADKLHAEAPVNAKDFTKKIAGENYRGDPDQASATGSIQRQSAGDAENSERGTATLEEVIEGTIFYIGRAWKQLEIKKMLWDTVVNMFWPPATIKAIFREFSLLWNNEWAATVDNLYTPRNFFDDPIGCLHDIWSNFLILLEFPLALWRTINHIIGLLMGYISIAIILVKAIAGGIAAAGVGVLPGILAGAAAGLAAVAALGKGLMISYIAAGAATVGNALTQLFTARQTCEHRQRDMLNMASNFIGMGVALALAILMALLSALVNLIVQAARGLRPGIPKTPPVETPIEVPLPARSPAPAPGGGDVIPFPGRPQTPTTPPAEFPIAAKFEDNKGSVHTTVYTSEFGHSSGNQVNGVKADEESTPEIQTAGLPVAAGASMAEAQVNGIDPEKCKEEDECEDIVVPGFAPQDNISRDHSRRHGGISILLSEEITQIREISGFRKISNYYGNNIAGFIYGIYENEYSSSPIDTGLIVERNDVVHSEERIIAKLLEIKRRYPWSTVIRVDQIGTERSACSTCYDLIRNSRILTENRIYTQNSAIYFIVRYKKGRDENANELRKKYCGIITTGEKETSLQWK